MSEPVAAEPPCVQALRSKTEQFLRQIASRYEVDGDRYLVRHGSTCVWVQPMLWRDESSVLRIVAVVLTGVGKSGNEGMFEDFSTMNDRLLFGKIYWTPDTEGTGAIVVEHNLLGETLDLDELKHAVVGLAITADNIDDQLQQRYGGKRWVD